MNELSSLLFPLGPLFTHLGLGLAIGAGLWGIATALGWVSRRLPAFGLLPRMVGGVIALLRLVAVVVVVGWGGLAFAFEMSQAAGWVALSVVLGLAVALTWTILQDFAAGLVLRLERRVVPGARIETATFSGTVASLGWRATVLLSPRGQLEVPNRTLLRGPLRVLGVGEHVLVLRVPPGPSTASLRRRIEDAVLTSAWTALRPEVHVHRDPQEDLRWVVHCRLLDPTFAPAFDADLVERFERSETLDKIEDASPASPSPQDASPPTLPEKSRSSA